MSENIKLRFKKVRQIKMFENASFEKLEAEINKFLTVVEIADVKHSVIYTQSPMIPIIHYACVSYAIEVPMTEEEFEKRKRNLK